MNQCIQSLHSEHNIIVMDCIKDCNIRAMIERMTKFRNTFKKIASEGNCQIGRFSRVCLLIS